MKLKERNLAQKVSIFIYLFIYAVRFSQTQISIHLPGFHLSFSSIFRMFHLMLVILLFTNIIVAELEKGQTKHHYQAVVVIGIAHNSSPNCDNSTGSGGSKTFRQTLCPPSSPNAQLQIEYYSINLNNAPNQLQFNNLANSS